MAKLVCHYLKLKTLVLMEPLDWVRAQHLVPSCCYGNPEQTKGLERLFGDLVLKQ